jgi:hypothetical protein
MSIARRVRRLPRSIDGMPLTVEIGRTTSGWTIRGAKASRLTSTTWHAD